MPRPCKRRRICGLPRCTSFSPQGEGALPAVLLTLDEYACLCLLDYEQLTQAQCAERLQVGRTTVTSIYASARRKIACCLAEGRPLEIAGGDYVVCEGRRGPHCCGCCHRQAPSGAMKGEGIMRIAAAYAEDGTIFQHFGHTAAFKLYEAEEGKVLRSQVVSTEGQGHGALAGLLRRLQVDVLICGGIGGGAQNALAEAGIQLLGGVSGNADEAVSAYLAGTLVSDPEVHCLHHEGQGGHSCGSHGCGGGSCH
jgi:predicted DNA-binding protein (UPF0251 family)/predicted Fe-Mo cluster-binding NifX family protein